MQADAMLNRIVDKAAADHNIIPEMYVAHPCRLFPGKVGDPTGAMPMVGYGAGAVILELLAPPGAPGTRRTMLRLAPARACPRCNVHSRLTRPPSLSRWIPFQILERDGI